MSIEDQIRLRPWQENAANVTMQRIANIKEARANGVELPLEERTVVLWLDPGMGKTLTWQYCTNLCYRAGLIDSVAVFTPRINLCQQAELDWKEIRPRFAIPVMGDVAHAENDSLFTEPDQFGYSTTYQSLVRSPDNHFAAFSQRDMALILDEAQWLGVDGLTGVGTKSAEVVTNLAYHAVIIFVLSGTPLRADGKRILPGLVRYSEKNRDGRFFLLPDGRASYLDGVKYDALCRFEFELFDGTALYEYMDGEKEILQMTTLHSGLSRILEDQGFWASMVDRTIMKVTEMRKVYRPYCGLIAAANIEAARNIYDYIRDNHPSIKALIALSDDIPEAKDSLAKFKMGGHDILITVQMAHVGYDHKPITVVCDLSPVTEEGWLRQLYGRGWRKIPDKVDERGLIIKAPEDQLVYVIGPDAPKKARIVEKLRRESDEALLEREHKKSGSKEESQLRFGETKWATIGDGRAQGMDPKNDVSTEEFPELITRQSEFGLGAAPLTGLKGLLTSYGVGIAGAEVKTGQQSGSRHVKITDKQVREALRSEIKTLTRRADGMLIRKGILTRGENGKYENGQNTYAKMKGAFKAGIDNRTNEKDLRARINWLMNDWLPYVEQL